VVSEIAQQSGFRDSLRRFATDAADPDQRDGTVQVRPVHLLGGKPQNRFKKTNVRLANSKLRCMHSYGKAAGACRDIVSGKRPLAALIQSAPGCKSEGMSRDYRSLFYDMIDEWIDDLRHLFW
jgi:hypothetical protein